MEQRYLFFVSIFFSFSLHAGMIDPIIIADRLQEYAVDPALAEFLDRHSDEIYYKLKETHDGRRKWGVWTFRWLPGYYVKYGLARIAGREKILDCIQRHNLDKVTVPDKFVYHVKGRPTKLSDLNYAVIIEKVPAAKHPPPITREEMEQLCTVMEDTGYISMTGKIPSKGPNYIRTLDGKFSIIDTESRFDHHRPIKGFLRIIRTHTLNKELSDEATQLVFEKFEKLMLQHPSMIKETLRELKSYLERQPHSRKYQAFAQWFFKGIKKRAFNSIQPNDTKHYMSFKQQKLSHSSRKTKRAFNSIQPNNTKHCTCHRQQNLSHIFRRLRKWAAY